MKCFQYFLLIFFTANNSFSQIPSNGLSLWLKADKGLIHSHLKINIWQDQSPNHFDVKSSMRANPQYISNAINALPAVQFNGVNNGLETPPFITFPNKRGSIFLVIKINGTSSTSGVGVGSILSTYHGNGTIWQFCGSPSKFSFYDGKGAEGFQISTVSNSGWYIIDLERSENQKMDFYIDGRLSNSIKIDDNQPDLNTLKIGYNGRAGGTATDSIPEVLNGEIAEIIVYNKALSTNEINNVHHYLSKKYGLTLKPPPFWQRWWFYALLLLLLFLLFNIVLLRSKQKKLKKQLQILEKQRVMDIERQRISREMHDDIGAGLTQITMMSEIAKSKLKENNIEELNAIAETGRKLVGSMSEIIWSLNPENNNIAQLGSYLREQLNKQLEFSNIQYSLELEDSQHPYVLSNNQRRNLLFTVKEIVNNAIKYSNAQHIIVTMTLVGDNLEFSIEDDGCGFDSEKTYSGNGLKNIKHRIAELGGQLKIISEKNKGSIFHFSVPLI